MWLVPPVIVVLHTKKVTAAEVKSQSLHHQNMIRDVQFPNVFHRGGNNAPDGEQSFRVFAFVMFKRLMLK